MNLFSVRKSLLKRCAYMAVCILLFSFALHMIEHGHEHPEFIFGAESSAAFHSATVKWWFVLIISMIAVLVFAQRVSVLKRRAESVFKDFATTPRDEVDVFPDPIRSALYSGRIQSKLYE